MRFNTSSAVNESVLCVAQIQKLGMGRVRFGVSNSVAQIEGTRFSGSYWAFTHSVCGNRI